MNPSFKFPKIGNSVGPDDTHDVSDTSNGIRMTAVDRSFERKIALAEQIMREDKDILHALA